MTIKITEAVAVKWFGESTIQALKLLPASPTGRQFSDGTIEWSSVVALDDADVFNCPLHAFAMYYAKDGMPLMFSHVELF